MSDRDMNFILYNTGRSVSPNFNFMLRVEGLFDLPCKSVHSFKKANEYEYIQEGGLNDYVHMKRKPISKPFTFEVERYVGVDILDPLQPGTELVLPIVLMVWRRVMYKNFTPFRVYTFTGCTVMEKKYGELDAEKSGLLVETTTIGYREMMRMTMPAGVFDDFGDNFDIAEELTPTEGERKTDSYSNRKAIKDERSTDATGTVYDITTDSGKSASPDTRSSEAKQRIWLGYDIKRQKAIQDALAAAKKNGDEELIKELESNPILKQKFTSTVSAAKDFKSTTAKERAWNGFNPNAKDPSQYDEKNPAPEGTVFTVSSAKPDIRSTDATGKEFKISEYKDLVPKTDEEKKTRVTDKFTNRSAHPDERSSEAVGAVYDITTDAVKSAHPDERSSDPDTRLWNGFNKDAKSPSDFDEENPAPEGTAFTVSSATPDKRSTKATPILWPGVKAGEKPPKTLRANVLRTLNSNTSTGSGSNEV